MAYDHGAFRVRNLDDAIAFYTGKLGFRFLFDGKNEKAAERYAFLDHNGARLELIETEHETYRPSMPEPPFCPHLCFEAENMDSVLKMLRENELTILDGPNEIPNSEQCIVLNLYILNILPYCVTLSCLKNTGPLESHFISIAIINIGNASTASIIDATTISNNLFTIKEALRLLTIL